MPTSDSVTPPPQRFRGKNLRIGRHSQPGQIYLVTTVTQQRHPVFADFCAARTLIQVLQAAQSQDQADTLAFVVMPDHLHWLLALRAGARLSTAVQTVKSVTAHRLNRKIWQNGFHDRALRQEEDLPAAARYLVANPLRAGLCQNIGDDPHWDAIWL